LTFVYGNDVKKMRFLRTFVKKKIGFVRLFSKLVTFLKIFDEFCTLAAINVTLEGTFQNLFLMSF